MSPYLKKFVKSYIATALWSSPCDSPEVELFDELVYTKKATLSYSFVKRCILDCQQFIQVVKDNMIEHAPYILTRKACDLDYLAPHDFWLTRCGHGAGFWDGDWDDVEHGALGTPLTIISHQFKELDIYTGDDNRVYFI